ncbi:MAG: hypothetical protein IK066_01565, partial [Kiritimatiellae bacterium]|nr:hypothetical protein [Kiritimatiellia bacterium]
MLALTCRGEPRARVLLDPDRGALVRSWVVPVGRTSSAERLHFEPWADAPSPPDLRGGIPVLFPFAGRVAAPPALVPGTWRWNGRLHDSMPIHGFAHSLPWTVLSATRHSALLALSDTPATRALYPFPFELRLRVSFRSPTALSLRLSVRNTGTEPLPCTPGFHPYLRLPAPDAPSPAIQFVGHARIVPYAPTCTVLVPPA